MTPLEMFTDLLTRDTKNGLMKVHRDETEMLARVLGAVEFWFNYDAEGFALVDAAWVHHTVKNADKAYAKFAVRELLR